MDNGELYEKRGVMLYAIYWKEACSARGMCRVVVVSDADSKNMALELQYGVVI